MLFVVLAMFGFGILSNAQRDDQIEDRTRAISEDILGQSEENGDNITAMLRYQVCVHEALLGPDVSKQHAREIVKTCIRGNVPKNYELAQTPGPLVIRRSAPPSTMSPTFSPTRRPKRTARPTPQSTPNPGLACLPNTRPPVCVKGAPQP